MTLIKDNNKMFVYDPTNLAVLKINSKDSASLINGTGTFVIKSMETLLFMPNADHKNLIEQLILVNHYPSYSRKEIIFSFEEMMELLKNNLPLLDSAYENIHPKLEDVCSQIDKLKEEARVLKKRG